VGGPAPAFSAAAGGVVCPRCQAAHRDRRPLSAGAWQALRAFAAPGAGWEGPWDGGVRAELRQLVGQYVTYRMGRRPRLLPYLGS
jgi:hypothetical protein